MSKKIKLSNTKKHIIELCVAFVLYFILSSIFAIFFVPLFSISASLIASSLFSDDIIEFFCE